MKILCFIILIFVSISGFGNGQMEVAPDNNEKPNILILFSDDLGYGDLGFTGSSQVKTPNLDKLASEGVLFTQAYVTCPFCAPSRAALLTGRYQQRFGFEFNPDEKEHVKTEFLGIDLAEKTLGDRMQALGYYTGIIGKWHLGEHENFYPTKRGFNYFFGMRGGGHSYFPTIESKNIPYYWYPEFALERNGENLTEIEEPYLTDWFTQDAINFIDKNSKNATPWFLYLSYNCPHGPLEAKPEDIAKYQHIENEGRRTYCGMIDNLDQNIGEVIKKLKETGQYENTVIIFMNDNGGSVETINALNAPYWGTKGTFYEGGIRVPMFIHYPKVLKNATYTNAVSAMDIMPTCINLAGSTFEPETRQFHGKDRTHEYDGINLLPYISGEKNNEKPHQKLFWRVMYRGSAMLDGDWKYIQTPHDLPQLYNIATDPSEQNDLAAKYPEKLKKMMDQHFDWCTSFEKSPMWMDQPYWLKMNKEIHRKEFQLVQPE